MDFRAYYFIIYIQKSSELRNTSEKSPNGSRTNLHGSISTMYYDNCYEKGQFKQSDTTAKEMQDFVKNKMKTMGFSCFLASLFSKGIPKLERWKN
ncbi:zinc ribbon domain-containing protein [Chryseobacterium sp. StRB126]|uniref:zinc ribbon domain-containing protein n=1 Tax=Chryseobacterium sp. StRB126 TaxID=878220 RepID=UPI003977C3B2